MNCFRLSSYLTDRSPSFSYSDSSTSTLDTTREYTNSGGNSATSSSADLSQFSQFISALIDGEILPTPDIKEFSFADLKNATRNFNRDMVLGVGGFGDVYKGWVDETTLIPSKCGTGMMVAIKKLHSENTQGFDEWKTKVDFLGKLSHPNLVKLLGHCWEDKDCWEDKKVFLVYEFMQKGSLENHLFRTAYAKPLSWDIRLNIAIGAARGLAFLHTSEKQFVCGDFKRYNILLDGSYNAKISNFGLAKLGHSGEDSHSYASPESPVDTVWFYPNFLHPSLSLTEPPSVKSDVYGFGVVLLEMLTGLRALDNQRPNGQQNLVDWVKPIISYKHKIKMIMDARIEGQYSLKAAHQVAQLTLRCLEMDPRKRPPMKEVVELLEQIAAIRKPNEKQRLRRPVNMAVVLEQEDDQYEQG